MYHLLSQEDKKTMTRRYKTRRVIVALALACAAGVSLFAALIPAYFFAALRNSEEESGLAAASAKIDPAKEQSLSNEISRANSELVILTPNSGTDAFDALETIATSRPANIHLSGIAYSSDLPGEIRIAGVADSREALLKYEDSLRVQRIFSKVELPISSFASNRDIPFAIIVSGQF